MRSSVPHILVAEDQVQMRMIVKTALHGIGMTNITSVGTGREAQHALVNCSRTDRIALILCDMEMPEMNGLEFLEWLRNDRRYKELPFVMLTSQNSPELVLKAIELGTNDYIVKPFQLDIFEKKIRKLLERS